MGTRGFLGDLPPELAAVAALHCASALPFLIVHNRQKKLAPFDLRGTYQGSHLVISLGRSLTVNFLKLLFSFDKFLSTAVKPLLIRFG